MLLIAQIATSVRAQLARRAGIDVVDVSITLLLRDLPYLLRDSTGEVLAQLAALPVVRGGYLRPTRRRQPAVPEDLPVHPPPDDLIRTRTPRSAGRRCGPAGTDARPTGRRS